jgi:hypothetical protein
MKVSYLLDYFRLVPKRNVRMLIFDQAKFAFTKSILSNKSGLIKFCVSAWLINN